MPLHMPPKRRNLLEQAAEGFGDLLSRTVFTGGLTLDLYATVPAAPEPRPGDAVRCVLAAKTRMDLLQWEQELLRRGFTRERSTPLLDTPWRFQDVRLDLLPSNPELMPGQRRWFEEGVFHARSFQLDGRFRIRILSSPYLIADKLEGLRQHGPGSLRLNEDFEDLVYLFAYRPELSDELAGAFFEVRNFLRQELAVLLRQPDLDEAVFMALDQDADMEAVDRVLARMRSVAALQAAAR